MDFDRLFQSYLDLLSGRDVKPDPAFDTADLPVLTNMLFWPALFAVSLVCMDMILAI